MLSIPSTRPRLRLPRLATVLPTACGAVVAPVRWPVHRLWCRRVEAQARRRLSAFEHLTVVSSVEKTALLQDVTRCQRASSRIDVVEELCGVVAFAPWLVLVPGAVLGIAGLFGAGLRWTEQLTGGTAFIVTLTGFWRLLRRVLPPQRFDSVGSRLYRQRPVRVLAAMGLCAAAGMVGNAWTITWADSGLRPVQFCTGLGLFCGAVAGGVWIAVRFVETFAGAVLEYLETFTQPRAVLVDNSVAILSRLDNDDGGGPAPDVRRCIIEQLEMSARCIERGLRRHLRCGDPCSDQWIRTRTAQMAAALRALKIRLVAAEDGGLDFVIPPVVTTLRSALTQEWGDMPTAESAAEPGRRLLARAVVTVVLVGFPLVLALQIPHGKWDQRKAGSDSGGHKAGQIAPGFVEKAGDWNGGMQLLAGLMGSVVVLLSRLDDLTNGLAQRRTATAGSPGT